MYLKGGDFFMISKNIFMMYDSFVSNSFSYQAGVSFGLVNYNFAKLTNIIFSNFYSTEEIPIIFLEAFNTLYIINNTFSN